MTRGCDYAWERPDPQALRSSGYGFAVRYVSYDTTGKNLTRTEAQRLSDAGLQIVTNWEWSSHDALGGFTSGILHAEQANTLAAACGMPDDRPIFFSVDFPPVDTQLPAVRDYIRGAATVLGHDRVGVYGGLATVRDILDRDLCKWAWQTYAWSNTTWDNRAQLRQVQNGVHVAGTVVDEDLALTQDFGGWTLTPPNPQPTPQGDDPMATWKTCSRTTADATQAHTVQGLLLARGYDDIGSGNRLPDGVWGDRTDASVRRFQADHRVANSVRSDGTGDGIVGPATLRALAGL